MATKRRTTKSPAADALPAEPPAQEPAAEAPQKPGAEAPQEPEAD